MSTCILALGGSSSGIMNLGLAWAREWDCLSKTKQTNQNHNKTKIKPNQNSMGFERPSRYTHFKDTDVFFTGKFNRTAIYGLPMRTSSWPGHKFHLFIFHCLLSRLRGHCYQSLLWNALSSHKNITVRPQPLPKGGATRLSSPAWATCSKCACNQENPVQHHRFKVHSPFPSFF